MYLEFGCTTRARTIITMDRSCLFFVMMLHTSGISPALNKRRSHTLGYNRIALKQSVLSLASRIGINRMLPSEILTRHRKQESKSDSIIQNYYSIYSFVVKSSLFHLKDTDRQDRSAVISYNNKNRNYCNDY